MSRDPFKLTGPTCLSFSGGRTSAYMLWLTLQSNTVEDIARWLLVCFANTGKEVEATLHFVRECSLRWSVPIVWLEYRGGSYATVDFETASRQGEPFEEVIRRRKYLPNPITRFCTSELKIRTMHRYLRAQGWTEWDQFIGLRADEQRRVAKIKARGTSTETPDETMCVPLYDAGIAVHDVGNFWARQPFNLELDAFNGRTLEGNCDLCFLKPTMQRLSIIKKRPEAPVWWIRMESIGMSDKPDGARFRKDSPSYADLAQFATDQQDMFDADEEAIECFCGD